MHHLATFSYRSLELLCRNQAAMASTDDTRRELLDMALEYQRLADSSDQQLTKVNPRK
jgi:hypothetical protein